MEALQALLQLVAHERGGYRLNGISIAVIAGLAVGIIVAAVASGVMDKLIEDKKKSR